LPSGLSEKIKLARYGSQPDHLGINPVSGVSQAVLPVLAVLMHAMSRKGSLRV
jgi:hypothetical protein